MAAPINGAAQQLEEHRLSMLELKRGDTFSYAGLLPEGWLPAGQWTAACKVYDKRERRSFPVQVELVPPHDDEPCYLIRLYASPAATRTWPARKLDCDIEFTDATGYPDPIVVSTNSFVVNVLQDYA